MDEFREMSQDKISAVLELLRTGPVAGDLDAALSRICDAVVEIMEARHAVIAISGNADEWQKFYFSPTLSAENQQILRRFLQQRRVPGNELAVFPTAEEMAEQLPGFHTAVLAPIGDGGAFCGWVACLSKKDRSGFSREEGLLLEAVSEALAMLREDALLQLKSKRLKEALENETHRHLQLIEALKDSRERFRQVVENIEGVFFLVDLEMTKTHYLSPGYDKLTGRKREEVYRNPRIWLETVHADDRQKILDEIMKKPEMKRWEKGEHSKHTLEYRIVRPDGSIRWLRATSFPVYDEDGKPYRVAGIAMDITDQMEAQRKIQEMNLKLTQALEDLKLTQARVVQQERLHALGSMASGIAHDFNNSLAPIIGLCDLALQNPENLDDKEKLKRMLGIIQSSATDASKVVSRLKEFYRHRETSEAFLPVDLNQLIENTIILTRPRWHTQAMAAGIAISIQKNLQPIPPVWGSEWEIKELLTNLLMNAVEAIPIKGTITFSTHKSENGIVLEVSDSGIGMPPEVQERCFEPFFTTKGELGTGLGLSSVFGTMQRHGGRIEVKSRVGQGTTFTLQFPWVEQRVSGTKEAAPASPSRSELSVLVVEDEPVIREIIAEFLQKDGHHVEIAANGREGLEKFGDDKFDLVITDRGMPQMGGDRLAQLVKRISPQKPVIMLTGFGDLMLASGEKPDGVDLIVSKPITLAMLREAVHAVVG